jgi:hypothetical protein
LRDAFFGITRFDEFQSRLGIARNILSVRLDTLVEAGVMERHTYDARGRSGYVKIVERTIDSDLESANCEGAVGSFDAAARIYRVNQIIDNTDGGCPQLQGFFPVEFVHEPDGVTYCLVQQG